MGCPGQARTKPRRKLAVASLPEIRRTAAAATYRAQHNRAMRPTIGASSCAIPAAASDHLSASIAQPPALEGLTRSARIETPRKVDRNKSDHLAAAAATAAMVVDGGGAALGEEGAANFGARVRL
ncbi:hypothetical protein F511_18225 [Dorcoceras hygrometricum]|uniref:Uncharacterized protein n=1 Tax=Dorcoceras hygrometricum TaxID=472368 RepID=A0A2Z7BFZ9_9LAMI|nr:hypothetical protein F511_18225 [Dorcoceras hygrometricum]